MWASSLEWLTFLSPGSGEFQPTGPIGPLPVFVNKVLWARGHTHSSTERVQLLPHYEGGIEQRRRRDHTAVTAENICYLTLCRRSLPTDAPSDP